jgi:3-hydroxyisobutyrate dehydrogenase-like beta-hydroxyacid dehydrogenase
MAQSLSLIGYGEAGTTFARAAGWAGAARVFDLNVDSAIVSAIEDARVVGCSTLAEALSHVPNILSLVTADQALIAAQDAARHIAPDTFYFDMNSVAPDTKRKAAKVITAAGGHYIDVAIMAPVNPARLNVPLLISGPQSEAAVATLLTLGFSHLRSVGPDVGRAATIKMLRSVIYKGLEALTAECVTACHAAGVLDEVSESLGIAWGDKADYRIDRMMAHGLRRAAEMEEVVKTLEGLGVEPLMTRGTVILQRKIGVRAIAPIPQGLAAKLKRLAVK